jgi:hypothetical protein
VALLILDVAMLGGTVTEGAHYFSDVLAGICNGIFRARDGQAARRIIGVEDRSFHRRRSYSISPVGAVQAALDCTAYPRGGAKPRARWVRRTGRQVAGALSDKVDHEISRAVSGKRSRFDVCRISFRKTGAHFSGKCSKS